MPNCSELTKYIPDEFKDRFLEAKTDKARLAIARDAARQINITLGQLNNAKNRLGVKAEAPKFESSVIFAALNKEPDENYQTASEEEQAILENTDLSDALLVDSLIDELTRAGGRDSVAYKIALNKLEDEGISDKERLDAIRDIKIEYNRRIKNNATGKIKQATDRLNQVTKGKQARHFRDLVNTLIHAKAYKEANALIDAAADVDDLSAVTEEAQIALLNYFTKNSNKDNPAFNADVLYLMGKVDSSWYAEKGITHANLAPESAELLFKARSKKPRSVLGLIPSMREFLRNPVLRKQFLGQQQGKVTLNQITGLKRFLDFEETLGQTMHELLPGLLDKGTSEDQGLLRKGKNESDAAYGSHLKDDFGRAPLHYLRDPETGELPPNVITSAAANVMTWLGTRAGETVFNTKDDIAKLFGLDKPFQVRPEALKTVAQGGVADAGILFTTVIDDLGKAILKDLNLTGFEGLGNDGLVNEKLGDSIAMLAIEAAIKLGYFEKPKQLNNAYYQWLKQKKSQKKEDDKVPTFNAEGTKVTFIRPTTVQQTKGNATKAAVSPKVKEVQGIFNNAATLFKNVLSIEAEEKRPLTQAEKDEGQTERVKTKIKGSLSKPDPTSIKAQKYLQESGLALSKEFEKLYQQFGDRENFAARILGKKDPKQEHIDEEASQEAKNALIDRQLDALEEGYSSGFNDENLMHLTYFTGSNTRSMVNSTKLNYQSNKGLDRIALYDPRWKTEISAEDLSQYSNFDAANVPDSIKRFFVAASFGLGLKTTVGDTKQGIDKNILDENFVADVHETLNTGVFGEAVQAIRNARGRNFTDAEMDIIADAVDEGGEKAWSLEVLNNYANLLDAMDKGIPFSHHLPMETDGITNGISSFLMQFPFFDPDGAFIQSLNRVGLFTNGDVAKGITSFGRKLLDFKTRTGTTFLDTYQYFAEGTARIINNYRTDNDAKFEWTNKNKRLANLQEEYPQQFKTFFKEILNALDQINVKHKDPVLDEHGESGFVQPFIDDNGNVTKEGRNAGKGPEMTTGAYSAGEDGMKSNVAYASEYGTAPPQKFRSQLMKVAKSDLPDEAKASIIRGMIVRLFNATNAIPIPKGIPKAEHQGLWDFNPSPKAKLGKIPSIQEILNFEENGEKGVFAFARRYRIPKGREDVLVARYKETYGQAGWETIQKQFEKQIEYRNKTINAIEVLAKAYVAEFDKRVLAKAKELNRGLSANEQLEIKIQLRKEGWMPNIRHANSKDNLEESDYIEAAPEEERLMSQYYSGVLDSGEAQTTLGVKGKTANGAATRVHSVTRSMPSGETKVGPFVKTVQSNEADTMHTALVEASKKDIGVFHIFDAMMTGVDSMEEFTKIMNDTYYKTHERYSIAEAVKEKVNGIVDKVLEGGNAEAIIGMATEADKEDFKALREEGMSADEAAIQVLRTWRLKFNDMADLVANERKTLFSKDGNPLALGAVNQYSLDGAHAEIEISEAAAQKRTLDYLESEANQETKFSGPTKPQWEHNFEERYRGLLNDKNIGHILDDMRRLDMAQGVELSPAHQEQLTRLLDYVVMPMLQTASGLKLHFGTNPDGTVNAGQFDGDTIFISAAGNYRTSPKQLSNQEILLHELVHAVTEQFIDHPDNFKWRQQVQALFNKAQENTNWTHFLPESSDGKYTREQEEAAKARYEYLFENPAGQELHEFMSIALTDQNFANHLATISDQPNEDLTEELKNKEAWKSDFLRQLWNVFTKAFEWFTNKANDSYRTGTLDTSILNLARKFATIEAQERTGLWYKFNRQYERRADQANEYIKSKTREYANPVVGYGLVKKAFGGKIEPIKYVDEKTGEEKTAQSTYGDIGKKAIDEISNPNSYFYEGYNKLKAKAAKQNLTVTEYLAKDNEFLKQLRVDHPTYRSLVRDSVREITGLPKRDLLNWRTYKRLAREAIDTSRKRIATTVQAAVAKSFEGKLKHDEWRALNDVLLRLDVSSLLTSFDTKKVLEFMQDNNSLNEAIRDIKNTIQRDYKDYAMDFINQAKNLGSMTSRGIVLDGIQMPMVNAHDIANLYYLSPEDRSTLGLPNNVEEAEKLLDALASLYALQVADPTKKERVAAVMQRELARGDTNGINALLNMHQVFKVSALAENFNGSKIGMRKGYTTESYDYDTRMEIASADPRTKAEMKEKGFEFIKVLPRDPMHQAILNTDRFKDYKSPMGMYVSRLGLANWQGQVVSLTNEQARGMTIQESFEHRDDVLYPKQEADKIIRQLKAKNYRLSKKGYTGELDMNQGNPAKLIPILSQETGEVVNMRYEMSDENKFNILGMEDRAHENIGRMFAGIHDKVQTKEKNRIALNHMFEEYKELRGKTKFKLIGAYSADPKNREMWRMLPEDMKYQAEELFGQKGIYVREDMENYILGNRKITLTGTLQKYNAKYGNKVPLSLMISIKNADDVWREIVNYARVRFSILLPEVVVENTVSNNLVLLADGIPPEYIRQKSGEAIGAMREYQKKREEKDLLEIEIQSDLINGKDVRAKKAKLNSLLNRLEANPVHGLVQEGLFQAIVETVNPEVFEEQGKSKLSKWVQEKAREQSEKRNLSDKTVKAFQEVMIMPGSNTFNMIMMANQYGDFVGRYVKFKYDTEVRKRNKVDAINDALDDFIYYDEPAHPYLAAMNDYGFFMYGKFFSRIQRVVFKLFRDKPATATMALILDNALGNPGVNDYFANYEKFANKLDVIPEERVGEAATILPLEWAKALTPGW